MGHNATRIPIRVAGRLNGENRVMSQVLVAVVVAVPAVYLVAEGYRVVRAPDQWPSNTNRWLVANRWAREPRPSDREIRFWGSVWVVIGFALVAMALAALAAAD